MLIFRVSNKSSDKSWMSSYSVLGSAEGAA